MRTFYKFCEASLPVVGAFLIGGLTWGLIAAVSVLAVFVVAGTEVRNATDEEDN